MFQIAKRYKYIISALIVFFIVASNAQASPLSACPAQKINASKSLSELNNQWVYVDFWASWCGPCRKTFPFMNELKKRYGDKLNIVAISVDDEVENAKSFLQRYPAKFSTYIDISGICPQVFKVKGMPSSYLISPQGKVVMTEVGFTKSSAKKLINALDKFLNGAEIKN